MPGDFKPRGGRGQSRGRGRGRGRGGFSSASNYTNKKRSSPDAADNDEKVPQTKRVKATPADEGGDETEDIVVPALKVDDQGNDYVALKSNDLRRATVSDFKGSILVSIREYYQNEQGAFLPGKKGISLSLDQFNALIASLPLLESSLAKLGKETVRPDYNASEEEAPVEEAGKQDNDKPAGQIEKETKNDDDWELDVAGYDD